MVKWAVAMLVVGSFLARAAIEDWIDHTFPNAQLRIVLGFILIAYALYRLHRKINLFK